MGFAVSTWLNDQMTRWLTTDRSSSQTPFCDYEKLSYELRPGDVVLVEGRSRVSEVIKLITQSPWTHSALYIGRLFDIEDPALRGFVRKFHRGDPHDQLLVEALMGRGTVITPLQDYDRDHLRICRPRGISRQDAQSVTAYCIKRLGTEYDTRQLLDLARFLFPYTFLPRRWRSSLFEHNAGIPTRTVCSSMLAEAFAEVKFPVLPYLNRDEHGKPQIYRRNSRLFAPRDFDYSPYFDIIKYPYLEIDEVPNYRNLPWNDDAIYSDTPRLEPAHPKSLDTVPTGQTSADKA